MCCVSYRPPRAPVWASMSLSETRGQEVLRRQAVVRGDVRNWKEERSRNPDWVGTGHSPESTLQGKAAVPARACRVCAPSRSTQPPPPHCHHGVGRRPGVIPNQAQHRLGAAPVLILD